MPALIENFVQPRPVSSAAEHIKSLLPDGFPGLESLLISPGRVESPEGAAAVLEPGPRGLSGLAYQERGKTVRLTSAVDPAAEDLALVNRADFDPGRGLLCLGLGLGYHLEELARRLDPAAPLWVLESRPELAVCALNHRDLSPLFQRPGFRLLIGPFAGPPWGQDENPPTQILWRPATLRHFASDYHWLPNKPPARVRPHLRRLLLVQSGYFLDRELARAAEELGLEVAAWTFQRGLKASGDNYQSLLRLIRDFRPELMLTVNHLGFDADGMMDDLLTRLSLPVASWFVDSPAFILNERRPSPLVRAFSWDRDYLNTLKSHGFSQVSYLPLATDESVFRPAAGLKSVRPLAFVGDSLTSATGKYLNKLGFDEDNGSALLTVVDELAAVFLQNKDLLPDLSELKKLAPGLQLPENPETQRDLAALITWRASRRWRLEVLSALPSSDLTVAGDRSWREMLNLPDSRLHPPLDYYRDLPAFYQGSRVNLNITSAQMKTGLNQRVFDVPAAGGFLLTDRREQLFELFEPHQEIVTYQSPPEARELAAWHLAHPAARDKIIQAARRRVLDQHLYRHRLTRLLAEMGK